jgi:ribonuclease I
MILMMTCCYLLSELTNLLFCNNKKDTRYYYLSLKRGNINSMWSIHGLWPEYSKTSYPQFCKISSFDIEKIQPIINDLKKFWYLRLNEKIDTKQQIEILKFEWEKHGTCMFNNVRVAGSDVGFDEFDYFKTVLTLYVEVMQSNIIDKFKLEQNGLQVKIPIDLNFKPILPN